MRSLLLFLFLFLLVKTNAQKIALNFAGDDDWVTGTNNSLPQGNASRTIEAWIKYNTSKNDMSIFNYGTFANNQKFTLHLYNGVYIIGEANDLATNYSFNDGNWHHVAVTHNGTTTIVYVDGIIRGSRNTTYNTTGFNYQMGTSLRNGSFDFRLDGTIDELRVWNVARTQQEITDNMYKGINTATGLIASYHLNDGVPNGDNRAITIVKDDSGNGYDGTLNNFALMGINSNFVDDAVVVLPLKLLNFTVAEANCMAHIEWKTTDEINMRDFIIEESKNAIDFSLVKQVTPRNTSGTNYYTIDIPVYSDISFYRLKMVEADNKISYSKTAILKGPRCGATVSVQTNPAKNTLYIRTNIIGREYRIYSTNGSLLKTDRIHATLQSVDISRFAPGLYYLNVTGGEPTVFIKE